MGKGVLDEGAGWYGEKGWNNQKRFGFLCILSKKQYIREEGNVTQVQWWKISFLQHYNIVRINYVQCTKQLKRKCFIFCTNKTGWAKLQLWKPRSEEVNKSILWMRRGRAHGGCQPAVWSAVRRQHLNPETVWSAVVVYSSHPKGVIVEHLEGRRKLNAYVGGHNSYWKTKRRQSELLTINFEVSFSMIELPVQIKCNFEAAAEKENWKNFRRRRSSSVPIQNQKKTISVQTTG